jgi:glycosyltransferase involved in cell wall biosynthesis
VDVTLLLEGTYPYVRGGVSSWVHQIVSSLPDVSFHLAFLGSRRKDYGAVAYESPPNVRGMSTHYLFDPGDEKAPLVRRNKDLPFETVARFHDSLREAHPSTPIDHGLLHEVLGTMGRESGVNLDDFLRADRSWDRIRESYERECPGGSFIEYFWTIRTMHTALFGIAGFAETLPKARAYHAVSTGYAGFLGAMLRSRQQRPLVLTEHGIYTKERKIDLAAAERIAGDGDSGNGFGRRMWIRLFEALGRITYEAADPVISLYEGNQRRQLQDGAPPERARIVPNGVDVDRFRPLRMGRPDVPPPVIGLLGRVVPIKDIKTFIRAMKTVLSRIPEAEGWIIGPTEEDKGYFAECEDLVRALGMEKAIRFTGFASPEKILPQVGLLALTSISEALPLVILEGYASGLPVVTTDVGACRELVEGRTPDDRALGAAGVVVPIADPEATGIAAVDLLRDPARWRAAQQAGIRRVETYYTRGAMIDAYRQVYAEASAWQA